MLKGSVKVTMTVIGDKGVTTGGRSHIAKFDPAPVAHQMTCECKP